jgi:hypothetical protein
MAAFVALAVQVIPLLIQAGLSIEPVIERLVKVNKDNITDADWDFLHAAQKDALDRINDTSRDVR